MDQFLVFVLPAVTFRTPFAGKEGTVAKFFFWGPWPEASQLSAYPSEESCI
jgi:hypothetical protein